jgi:simple sugar transport system substrate-binding protein
MVLHNHIQGEIKRRKATMKKMKIGNLLIAVLFLSTLVLSACATATTAPTAAPTAAATAVPTTAAAGKYTFGILLVGPYNDQGWSQSTLEGAQYAVAQNPNLDVLYIDNVNTTNRPGTTAAQIAESLVEQGAKYIIFNSDDMKDDSNTFAKAHPDIVTIELSGDQAWKEGEDYLGLPNMGNIMGKMIYGKMIAGCTAALTTQTGQIGYLGPLINDETRRLASSVYLGAKYCWTNYLGKNASDLSFKVTWIGFWFNIPGVTSDPTQVADDFFNSGYDVVVSGIDTTEALVEAKKLSTSDAPRWAIGYDYKNACDVAPDVCLGVPYFNWGPAMLKNLNEAVAGNWTPSWEWNPPNWSDINNPDNSAVGFTRGSALSSDASSTLDKFISELGGGLDLWTGPINLQDKTEYLKDGEVATEQQIWYLPQLLEGMQGQSVPSS